MANQGDGGTPGTSDPADSSNSTGGSQSGDQTSGGSGWG